MYDPYAEFTKSVLSNGLEVHSLYWDRPWVRVEIVVHAGGREDPASLPGLAHLLEHIVNNNIPGKEKNLVKEFFETCGGTINLGITHYLYTRYNFSIPRDQETFRTALDILGSMLFQAKTENYLEQQKEVILREFRDLYPFAETFTWETSIREALFKGHRLETYPRTPIGRPEGFLSATTLDLQTFYDMYYVPENVSLVVIGGQRTDQLIAELEGSPFGIKKGGTRNPIPKTLQTLPLPIENSKTVNLSEYVNYSVDRATYTARWAFPIGFPNQARRVFSKMLDKILFEETRQKRVVAYSFNSSYGDFQDVSEFQISGTIKPEAADYINEIVRECISMVSLQPDLFEKTRKGCMQRCLMHDSSGEDLADQAAIELAHDHRIISLQETWNSLEKVTFEQMLEAVELLSSDRQYTFITRP